MILAFIGTGKLKICWSTWFLHQQDDMQLEDWKG